ncbi:hypothetical protein ACFQW6_10800 [Nocardioides sp. GCM10028917]|uniref:hypothetical protein n=1 Tax=Nocardioides sp. GCM10028917 TaxID=3273408 RepID=UPI00361EBD52
MDVTSAKIVELRVHGVSGTPPEEMLETHHARQEAGDEYSRFFVAVDCFGDKPPDPVEDGTGPHVRSTRLEGFHWGRYTSGNWRQALWLALVPFGMVNAAQFMLSPPSSWRERFFHTVVGGALRLLALGLTATFALAASSISIDLVARQRLATTRLGEALGEGTLLAAGALLAATGVLVLYRLGRRNTTVRQPPDAADTLGRSLGDTSGLTRENFYAGDPDATSLGRLHLAGGWATVALVGSLTDGDAQLATSLSSFVYAASAGLLAALAVLVSVLGDPEHSAPRSWERDSPLENWNRVLQRPAVGITAASLALAVLLSSVVMLALRGVNPDNPLAAVDEVSNTLVVVLTGALLVLFAASAGLAHATRHLDAEVPRPFRRYAAGMAAPVVAALGAFLAVGYSAALLLASAELLVDDAALPKLVEGVTFIWGISMLLSVVVGLVLGFRTWTDRDWRTERVRRSYGLVYGAGDGSDEPTWLTDERVRRIATASAVARVKLGLPVVLVCFSLLGMALAVLLAVDLMTGVGAPDERLPDDWVEVISRLGALTLIALAGLLMTTARQSLRARDRQRVVNVVWDVVSFWPRSVHPFVPPPYSQFAVQSLRDRIRHHLGTCTEAEPSTTEVADAVVVEAHSQGSFISVAALLWLNPYELSRVGFLTFGSQLQVIFPRAFPAYTSYRVLTSLDRALGGRWINLFRDTDPIAGPVLSWAHTGEETQQVLRSRRLGPPARPEDPWPLEPDHLPAIRTGRRECGRDWRLLDPSPPDRELHAEPLSSMMQHGHFALSPDWDDAVEWLATRTLGRTPAVPSPREDVRTEPSDVTADATDDAGEMMGPVDYQAHD